jgi:hypothetical protein
MRCEGQNLDTSRERPGGGGEREAERADDFPRKRKRNGSGWSRSRNRFFLEGHARAPLRSTNKNA